MRAAVFYATREGQARRVAERVATVLRARQVEADVVNVETLGKQVDWPGYQAAFVIASVHAGHHEKEMLAFARTWRDDLTRLRASFLSLTLSQAGVEDPKATAVRREAAREDAARMIAVFVEESGWRPAQSLPVAGALMYSRYNVFMKFIMKRIAHNAGFDGDTSHDYEFTNWPAVDAFVNARCDDLRVAMARSA